MDCPYTEYYLNQSGNGVGVYFGALNQRGHGVGSLFSSIFKAATPLLKRGGRYLAGHLIKTGSAVANDVMSGQNLRDSLKRRLENTGQIITDDAVSYLGNLQSGSGLASFKRRRVIQRRVKKKQSVNKGRRVKSKSQSKRRKNRKTTKKRKSVNRRNTSRRRVINQDNLF